MESLYVQITSSFWIMVGGCVLQELRTKKIANRATYLIGDSIESAELVVDLGPESTLLVPIPVLFF